MSNAEFNKIYQRSLPVEAAPLVTMLLSNRARLQAVIDLQDQYPDILIDKDILVLGDEPFVAMSKRIQDGYAAVGPYGSSLDPIPAGQLVPPGYIKVSLHSNDYPIHPTYIVQGDPPFDDRWPRFPGPAETRGLDSCWLSNPDDHAIVDSLWSSGARSGHVGLFDIWYEKQVRTDIFRGIPQIVWVRIAEPVPNLFA